MPVQGSELVDGRQPSMDHTISHLDCPQQALPKAHLNERLDGRRHPTLGHQTLTALDRSPGVEGASPDGRHEVKRKVVTEVETAEPQRGEPSRPGIRWEDQPGARDKARQIEALS
ncbi:MAG TPA: hypothetical protein VLR88_07180 [Propionibacteriaceae bacterium]|nr:hypothetical protein [Propionibacteriaceae bacterium]